MPTQRYGTTLLQDEKFFQSLGLLIQEDLGWEGGLLPLTLDPDLTTIVFKESDLL